MTTPTGRTVLIVDDEEPIRRAARRMLEKVGYTVLEAENGARAVELLSHPAVVVDLLMADLQMPELTGEEMARQIRSNRRDLKVLYVSGHVDRSATERPALWEGEAFLGKPFTFAGLTQAVSSLLHGSTRQKR